MINEELARDIAVNSVTVHRSHHTWYSKTLNRNVLKDPRLHLIDSQGRKPSNDLITDCPGLR